VSDLRDAIRRAAGTVGQGCGMPGCVVCDGADPPLEGRLADYAASLAPGYGARRLIEEARDALEEYRGMRQQLVRQMLDAKGGAS